MLAGAACGGEEDPATASLPAAGRGAPAGETLELKAGGREDRSKADKGERKRAQEPDSAKQTPGAGSPEDGEGNRTPSGGGATNEGDGPGAPSEPGRRGGRSGRQSRALSVSDPRGDLEGEGDAPSYADVTLATLEMSGGTLSVSFDLAGRLPARMSGSETASVIGIDIAARRADLSVYAEGSDSGWRLRSNRGTGAIDLSVGGRRVSFDIPTSLFDRARHFNWDGYSSWTRSTFTETEYYFDQAPDLPPARFPAR